MSAEELVRQSRQTPSTRLLELLIKLRGDELDRQLGWEKAIRARAKDIAKKAEESLTNRQRRLITKVDAGRLLEVGQHIPDPISSKPPPKGGYPLPPTDGEDAPGFRWVDGLREIDKQAYIYRHHRGESNTTACRGLAEKELENEAAPEWQRHRCSLWAFVIEKLWIDHACHWGECGKRFENLGLFDGSLCEAARHSWAYGPVEVDPISLRFLREQDESGYTEKLIAALWVEYRSDCETIPLQEPDDGSSNIPDSQKVIVQLAKRVEDLESTPVAPPSLNTISNRQAAKLYSGLVDTKPNFTWIGQLIIKRKLASEADGRTTEGAIARYAENTLRQRKLRKSTKSPRLQSSPPSEPNLSEHWKFVCPRCSKKTPTLLGGAKSAAPASSLTTTSLESSIPRGSMPAHRV